MTQIRKRRGDAGKNRRGDAETRGRGEKRGVAAQVLLLSPRRRVAASPRLFFSFFSLIFPYLLSSLILSGFDSRHAVLVQDAFNLRLALLQDSFQLLFASRVAVSH